MAIDKQTLRQSFGSFMTGVTIVTAMNDHDVPVGFTANSFTSVSLDPALLLICIDKKSENIDTFTKGSGFAVNVLSHHQQEISNRFASPIEDRFDGVDWHKSDHNNPILSDVTAYFDCLLDQVIDAGDHYILLGLIKDCASSAVHGLGYHRGHYFSLNDELS